jgi:hypothetical protein
MKRGFSENGNAIFKHEALIVLDEEHGIVNCLGSDQFNTSTLFRSVVPWSRLVTEVKLGVTSTFE